MHCKSRHVSAETEIVSLVSSFVIVLTLSESFAGSGFRNPGRWTVSLEIPMQPSPVARTTTGATSEERRRRGGGEGGKRNARCCYLFSYKITILQTIYIF